MLRFAPNLKGAIIINAIFELLGFAYIALWVMDVKNVMILFCAIYFLGAISMLFGQMVPQMTCAELVAASERRVKLEVNGFVGISTIIGGIQFVFISAMMLIFYAAGIADISLLGVAVLVNGITFFVFLLYAVISIRFYNLSNVFFIGTIVVLYGMIAGRIVSMDMVMGVSPIVGVLGGIAFVVVGFFLSWKLAYVLRKRTFDKRAIGLLLRNKLK